MHHKNQIIANIIMELVSPNPNPAQHFGIKKWTLTIWVIPFQGNFITLEQTLQYLTALVHMLYVKHIAWIKISSRQQQLSATIFHTTIPSVNPHRRKLNIFGTRVCLLVQQLSFNQFSLRCLLLNIVATCCTNAYITNLMGLHSKLLFKELV